MSVSPLKRGIISFLMCFLSCMVGQKAALIAFCVIGASKFRSSLGGVTS